MTYADCPFPECEEKIILTDNDTWYCPIHKFFEFEINPSNFHKWRRILK
jgi:hypothetical protein